MSYYVSVAPHNPLGPIATAAAVQFDFATPKSLIQEAIRSDVPWRYDVVQEPLTVRDGFIDPNNNPGLGIEVNEKEAAKHPFAQEVLMTWFHPDGAAADW